jgi:hypothetical protein
VRGPGGTVRSSPFSFAAPPPECAPEDSAACGEYNDPVPDKPYLKGWK